MRIAVVSDIHGNRTAFEAVLTDLHQTSPDLIFHGGDLADAGSSGVEIVDRIRDLGWAGVLGNTDEMLWDPGSLQAFANGSPAMQPLLPIIEEMAAHTREKLGAERLAWLSSLPRIQVHESMALVHATRDTTWKVPADSELESVYREFGRHVVVYGHIHRSYIRNFPNLTVVNTGSVSLSYDGDRRAAYLLLDDGNPGIRRVEYDVDKELKALSESGQPHSEWIAKTLATGRPQMP
jgi:putative phosphoesterase